MAHRKNKVKKRIKAHFLKMILKKAKKKVPHELKKYLIGF